MATYKIICSTDGYSASRHSGFSREGVKVMEEGLTLQEAQKALTKLYNRLYDFAPGNWGLIVSAAKRNGEDQSNPRSFQDGTRSFQSDVFTYLIEAEED